MDRRAPRLATAAAVVLALVWFWPAFGVGFLSDDYLAVYYLDRTTGEVRWDRGFEELWRPWFGVRDLWRPLVSLSFCADLALHGAAPAWFHVTNVAAIAVAAGAVAYVGSLLGPDAPARTALAAGALFALHPALVEPACWIAARTTGLEVCFSTLAFAAFAAHVHGRTRARWPYCAALLLALASKEGAIAVPAGFLCLDFAHRAGRSLGERLRLHGPPLLVVAAWLAWRKTILGVFTSMAEEPGLAARLARFAKLAGELTAPSAPPSLPALAPVLAFVAVLALASALAAARPGRLLSFALWIAAALLPATFIATPSAWAGRFVAGAVPALALACANGAFAGTPTVAARLARIAALLLLAGATGLLSRWWQREYREGSAIVAEMAQQVSDAAAQRGPGRPLALFGLAQDEVPMLLLHGGASALIALRPFAAEDHAVIGLPGVLEGDAVSDRSMEMAHAVLAAGGAVAFWSAPAGGLRVIDRPTAPRTELVETEPGSGRFAPASPLPALAAETVEVVLPERADGCTLRLADDVQPPLAFGERAARPGPDGRTFRFDLTGAAPPFLFAVAGAPFPGCIVAVGGAAPPPGTIVRVGAMAPLPLAAPLQGRTIALADLERIVAPPAGDEDLRLFLLLPTVSVSAEAPRGAPFHLPEAVVLHLRYARDLLGTCPVHCFWQTTSGSSAPRRSAIDWFEVR